MNGETVFEALTHIDDTFITESAALPKRRAPVWLRVTAVAACLAMVIGGAVWCIPKQTIDAPSVSVTTKPNLPEIGNMIVPLTPENETYPIVYPSEEDRVPPKKSKYTIFFSYKGPAVGECILHPWLSISMNSQENPNTIYWVKILLISNTTQTPDTIRAEAQRLADIGYEIYMRGNGIYGYFTKEHLEHFCGSTDYGYSLLFATESHDECERLYANT